jgi:hypothetical protein
MIPMAQNNNSNKAHHTSLAQAGGTCENLSFAALKVAAHHEARVWCASIISGVCVERKVRNRIWLLRIAQHESGHVLRLKESALNKATFRNSSEAEAV